MRNSIAEASINTHTLAEKKTLFTVFFLIFFFFLLSLLLLLLLLLLRMSWHLILRCCLLVFALSGSVCVYIVHVFILFSFICTYSIYIHLVRFGCSAHNAYIRHSHSHRHNHPATYVCCRGTTTMMSGNEIELHTYMFKLSVTFMFSFILCYQLVLFSISRKSYTLDRYRTFEVKSARVCVYVWVCVCVHFAV